MRIAISISYDDHSPTFSRCKDVLSFYYKHYSNITVLFYKSSALLEDGRVCRQGNDYLVGCRSSRHTYDQNYVWTDDDLRANNHRDRIFFSWLIKNFPEFTHIYTCSCTSITHPLVLEKIICSFPDEKLYMGKIVDFEGGPKFFSGAGILYSRSVFERLVSRLESNLDCVPDDIRNRFLLPDIGMVPATRLDVYDTEYFLESCGIDQVISDSLSTIIRDGYYHVRVKCLAPSNRSTFDPRVLFKIALFYLELDTDSDFFDSCLLLLNAEFESRNT